MSIDFNNMEDMSVEEILSFLDAKRISAEKKREEIKKLRSAIESTKIVKTNTFEEVKEEISTEKEDNDDFEKEVEYYLSDFMSLESYDKESIEDVLPSRSNYNYEKIVLRIMAEITHDIRDINEIIYSDDYPIDWQELVEYKEELLSLTNKRNTLKEILLFKEDEVVDEKKNKLIFLPIKGTDEYRIFDELKYIPQEEYEGFLELFESIKNGTFKNARRFTNNVDLNGALEVKGHQIRVVYKRLSKDCYGIVSMFMKKTQNSTEYRATLINRYSEYKSIEKELKENIKDPDFILKNQEIEDKLFSELTNGKGYVGGGK